MTPRPERAAACRLALIGLVCGCLLAACESPQPRRSSSSSSAPRSATTSMPAPARTAQPTQATRPTTTPVAPSKSTTAAATPAPAAVKPLDPDARFKAALAQMKARQFADAQAGFLSLSRDYPAFSGPLTNLGILYAQGQQKPAALASFSKAVDANPKNAVALNWLGILYRESGDYARAGNAYQRALVVRPDYAPAVLNLGILYDVFLHRPNDALGCYRTYQKLTGGSDLIVTAWIRDLESPMPAATPVVTAELAP